MKAIKDIETLLAVQDNPKDLFVKISDSVSVYNDNGYIYVYVDGVEMVKKSTAIFVKYPGMIFSEIQNVIDASINAEESV